MGGNKMSNKHLITFLTGLVVCSFFLFACNNFERTEEENGLRVIIDTDLGPDVDDVLAVAQLHALADLNEVEILATVHTSSFKYGPGALSALNKWHGRKVPIGAIHIEGLYNVWLGEYTKRLYENFPRYEGLRHTVDDVVTVYRNLLSRTDGKITITTIGFLNGIELLLKSSGDSIDSRTGVGLLKDKCAGIIIMGGSTLNNWRSWNFHGNSNAAVEQAARYVLENWPESVPMAFCPSDGENHSWGSTQWGGQPADRHRDDLGIAVGTDAPNQPDEHIVKEAMRAFGGVHIGVGIHLADPATVLYTVRPHRFVTRRGRLSWAAEDDGATTWSDNSEGPHFIVDGYVGTSQDLMNELETLTWTEQYSTPAN
jgi:hypothetical protein